MTDVILTDRVYHGTLLSTADLENIGRWLDLRLHGAEPQVEEIFQFVKDRFEADGYNEFLNREAPGITIALASASNGPRIDFVQAS